MNAACDLMARVVVDETTGQKYKLIPIHDYDPCAKAASISDILGLVADSSGISLTQLKADRRSAKYAFPRQVAYWCCAQYTTASSVQIGRQIGHRDHTTVLSGVKKIDCILNTPNTPPAAEACRIISDVQKGLGL